MPITMPAVRLLQRRGPPPLPMFFLSPRLPTPLRLLALVMHPLPPLGLPLRETMPTLGAEGEAPPRTVFPVLPRSWLLTCRMS